MPITTKLQMCPGCTRSFPSSRFEGSSILCMRCVDELAAIRTSYQEANPGDPSTELFATRLAASARAREQELARKQLEAEQAALQAEIDRRNAVEDEIASKALARRSLLHYVERRVGAKYKTGWVHEDIARRIERFVEQVENEESPRLALQLPPRSGKLLAHDTRMLTANRGWVTHGDLEPGDYVFGSDGRPTRIVAVGKEMQCNLAVTFPTETIITHTDHEWLLKTKDEDYAIYETGDLLKYARADGTMKKTFDAPPTPALHWNENPPLLMDPHALGVWLGDGNTREAVITHAPWETELITAVEEAGYDRTYSFYHFSAGSMTTRFGQKGKRRSLLNDLRALNEYNNKHVPRHYLHAPLERRLQLIAGLIDTDGSLHHEGRTFTWGSVSLELARGYHALLLSAGMRPRLACYIVENKKKTSRHPAVRKPYWVVTCSASRGDLPLRLSRKSPEAPTRPPRHNIRKITPVTDPKHWGRCIQVEAADGIYLAGDGLIPTHNSELASDSGPAWILGHHPDWTIMITSYSDELPTEWSRSIRDQLKSPEFQELFPDGAEVSKYDAAAKAWSTTQGGNLRAAGAGGSILGFGAHIAVVDDPVKGPEDADNPATMKKQWDWATSTLYSRLATGGGILLIMQRWSDDDLIGRFTARQEQEEKEVIELRKAAADLRAKNIVSPEDERDAQRYEEEADELEESMDRWEVVRYPALATGDEYLTPDGRIVSTEILGGEEPQSDWRLLRKKGEALHPERYSRSYYLKLKRNNPRRFAAMYQQSPVIDDGDYFSRSDFSNRYRSIERPELRFLNVFCTWDLAIGTQEANDFTVGLAGGFDHTGRLWLLDRKRGRWGDLELVADLVIDMHLRWQAVQTGIERTHLEMALSPVIKRHLRERNAVISLAEGKEALKPISDKRIRARQFQALAKAGLVMIPEGEDWDDYIDWLVKFGSTKTDDDVDASAWLAILANRYELPSDPYERTEDEKSWYEKLIEDYESGQDLKIEKGYMAS